jgi:hypothetical protein
MPTMKERLAIASRVQIEYQKALTPEQIAKPPCRWFHKWVRVSDEPEPMTFAYFQCRKCHDRKAVGLYCGGGYAAPPGNHWLDGKEWGYIPPIPTASSGLSRTRSGVPPPPPPQSVQVTHR